MLIRKKYPKNSISGIKQSRDSVQRESGIRKYYMGVCGDLSDWKHLTWDFFNLATQAGDNKYIELQLVLKEITVQIIDIIVTKYWRPLLESVTYHLVSLSPPPPPLPFSLRFCFFVTHPQRFVAQEENLSHFERSLASSQEILNLKNQSLANQFTKFLIMLTPCGDECYLYSHSPWCLVQQMLLCSFSTVSIAWFKQALHPRNLWFGAHLYSRYSVSIYNICLYCIVPRVSHYRDSVLK